MDYRNFKSKDSAQKNGKKKSRVQKVIRGENPGEHAVNNQRKINENKNLRPD